MKTPTTVNKVQFQNQLVAAMLSTDERLSFKYFNNRRYFFNFMNEEDIVVLIELRVHLNAKRIVLTVKSKSTLNETVKQLELQYYYGGFLDLKTCRYLGFVPTDEVLIRDATKDIHANLLQITSGHISEIAISRRGISVGMKYPLDDNKIPIEFPSVYSSMSLKENKNEQFKALYIHLFKALDMANSKIDDFRIRYVLLSIIQVILTNKKIPFINPVH
ncbi:MAG: hypothetical protein GQ574_29035 [Crocinitomix sp.]|nr:hypothetical protein [Crocinitomix sp.]